MTDDVSAPYWDGAAAGRVVLQRCDGCGTIRHYPRVLCSECHEFASSPVDGGTGGAVHSWTVVHHRFSPELPAELPYTLVTVDMDAGVRILGLLEGSLGPRIGMGVQLRFDRRGSHGTPIPVFTPDVSDHEAPGAHPDL